MRLAIVASHPVQYQSPLFRELAGQLDLTVFYAHRATPEDQAAAGFGVSFDWDIDLFDGFESRFLRNASNRPGVSHFSGCDTPGIGPELKRGGYGALLVMGWHLKCYVQAIWAAKRLGMAVMVRGDSQMSTPRAAWKRVAKRAVYPAALRVFDAALYVGTRSRAYYEHYSYPGNRLFFSPHCVDNEWFASRATDAARRDLRAKWGVGPETACILFAGKLLPLKRPLDLIAAASGLRPEMPDIAILVAGSGELEGAMAERARQEGIRLVHLGFCNQSEMPGVYAAADVMVLPSEHETWGLVANEALACGKPVILSDACGAASDLTGGRAGLSYPAGDIEALQAALSQMLLSPPDRLEIAQLAERCSLGAAAAGVSAALASIRPGRFAIEND